MAGPASSMSVMALRVARLTANGTPDFNNASGGFMFCGGISSLAWDWDTQEGEDIYEQDARGEPCVIRKREDKPKRVTFTLTMCRDDYRLTEILLENDVDTVLDGSKVVGRTWNIAQGCGTVTTKNGVSLEVWGEQWDCAAALTDQPYMRKVFPRCYLTPAGYTWENAVAKPVYKGWSTSNANFGDGPFGDLDLLNAITGWAMVDIDNSVVPSCPSPIGYINIPPTAS